MSTRSRDDFRHRENMEPHRAGARELGALFQPKASPSDAGGHRRMEETPPFLHDGISLSEEAGILLLAELDLLPPWTGEAEALPSMIANVKTRLRTELETLLDAEDGDVDTESPATLPPFGRVDRPELPAPPSETWSSNASSIRDFRRKVNQALERYIGDRLTTEVIRPLRERWDMAALYLLDNSETALEVAASSEITAPHTIRYPIKSETPDIVVDVFDRCRAERLQGGGWDPRYNSYLREAGHHERFMERLFVPLILARSRYDCSVQSAAFGWVAQNEYWWPAIPSSLQAQVIGTLSLSRILPGHDIDANIRDALTFAGSVVPRIAHCGTIRGLSDIILVDLIKRFGACHGAIHIGRHIADIFDDSTNDGITRTLGGVGDIPRSDGLGASAIQQGHCIHIGGSQLEQRDEPLAKKGVQYVSVSPLFDGHGTMFGLVYLHYDRPQHAPDFTEFAEIAGEALSVAMNARRNALLPMSLLAEARGFMLPRGEALDHRLRRMAGFTSNLLGCDHVSLVVKGLQGPQIVHYGRYIQRAPRELAPLNNALRALYALRVDGPVYVPSNMPYPVKFSRGSFVLQEKIRATAVIPISGVGLLVIDYRSPHRSFSQSERALHAAVAELVANGIRVLIEHDYEPSTDPLVGLSSAVENVHGAAWQALHLGFEREHGWTS